MYVKKGICAWKEKVDGAFCQCVGVKLKGRSREIGIYVVYRSPNSRENDEELCAKMRRLNGRYVVVGDFNYPGIRWVTGGSDARGRAFYDMVEDMHMSQHIEEPTHTSGNTLDLLLSSEENTVRDVRMEGRLVTSDHELIEADLLLEVSSGQTSEYVRDYGRGDFAEMRRQMQCIRWHDEMESHGVEQCWTFIKGVLSEMTEALVPMKRKRS